MGSGNSAIEKTKALGNKHFAQGNYRLAVKFYTKALRYDPYNQALLSNRSASYLKLNRPGKALDDALSLLTAAPAWVKSYYRLASALADLGLFREAQYYAQIASSLSPGDPSISSLLSSFQSRQILSSDKSSTLEWGYQLRPKAIDSLVGIHFADL